MFRSELGGAKRWSRRRSGWVSTHLPLCGLSCVPHDLNIDVLVIKVNVFEDRTL